MKIPREHSCFLNWNPCQWNLKNCFCLIRRMGFRGGAAVKNLLVNAGNTGSIPGTGRSPGVGNGNPLQVTEKYLPGKFYGQKYLVGYSLGGCKESEMTEQPSMHSCTPKTNTVYVNYNTNMFSQFSSVQFSRSVVSDSSQPHESQHARPPCPSPTPGVHSDSRLSSQ